MRFATALLSLLFAFVASSNANAGTEQASCEKCAVPEVSAQGGCVQITHVHRSWRRPSQVFGYLRHQPVRNVVRWSGNVVLPPYPVARVVIGLQPRVTCQFVQSNGCCQ